MTASERFDSILAHNFSVATKSKSWTATSHHNKTAHFDTPRIKEWNLQCCLRASHFEGRCRYHEVSTRLAIQATTNCRSLKFWRRQSQSLKPTKMIWTSWTSYPGNKSETSSIMIVLGRQHHASSWSIHSGRDNANTEFQVTWDWIWNIANNRRLEVSKLFVKHA